MRHSTLEEMLEQFVQIPGAISATEAAAVYQLIASRDLGHDVCVYDFGSHAGKIGTAITAAIPDVVGIYFAVDPLYALGENDDVFRDTVQGSAENVPWGHARADDFREQVYTRLKKKQFEVHLIGDTSLRFMDGEFTVYHTYKDIGSPMDRYWSVSQPVPCPDIVFIDSDDHQEDLCRAECERLQVLSEVIGLSTLVFFHDFGNQYHGPVNVYAECVDKYGWKPVDLPWDEVKEIAAPYEARNDSWHMPGEEQPMYVGCLMT